jgi:uncharacterized protein (DUF427 family)
VSLTSGRGPLSADPAGWFSPPLPEGTAYVEPVRRRVRGFADGQAVIDTEAALLVHRPGHPPTYVFPVAEVPEPLARLAQPEPEVPDHVQVPWDALEAWFEEDEPVLLHPRNPYHRVECLRTGRRLQVELRGTVLFDGLAQIALYETALEPRLYVAPEGVADGVLVPSATTTHCPSKGDASYWSAVLEGERVDDVAWSYEDPRPESLPIRALLCFDERLVEVTHDLPPAR